MNRGFMKREPIIAPAIAPEKTDKATRPTKLRVESPPNKRRYPTTLDAISKKMLAAVKPKK